MFKRFLERVNQPLTHSDFIGVAVYHLLEDMARDIAILEPDPVDWGGWVSYMLEQLELEAQQRVRIGDFEKMLRTLADELVNRVDSGKW